MNSVIQMLLFEKYVLLDWITSVVRLGLTIGYRQLPCLTRFTAVSNNICCQRTKPIVEMFVSSATNSFVRRVDVVEN
jgi:hypothetical protein